MVRFPRRYLLANPSYLSSRIKINHVPMKYKRLSKKKSRNGGLYSGICLILLKYLVVNSPTVLLNFYFISASQKHSHTQSLASPPPLLCAWHLASLAHRDEETPTRGYIPVPNRNSAALPSFFHYAGCPL